MANGQFTVGISVTSIAAAVLVAFGSILWSHIETVKNNANIAIDVAGQHGQELLAVRSQLEQHTMALAELRAQLNLGGRFTRADGDRLEKRLERLDAAIDALEHDGR